MTRSCGLSEGSSTKKFLQETYTESYLSASVTIGKLTFRKLNNWRGFSRYQEEDPKLNGPKSSKVTHQNKDFVNSLPQLKYAYLPLTCEKRLYFLTLHLFSHVATAFRNIQQHKISPSSLGEVGLCQFSSEILLPTCGYNFSFPWFGPCHMTDRTF